jgi:hypothetical protein
MARKPRIRYSRPAPRRPACQPLTLDELSPPPRREPGPLEFLVDRSDLCERFTEAMVAIPRHFPHLALGLALATAGALAAHEAGALPDLRGAFLGLLEGLGSPTPRRPWSTS